MVPSTTSTSTPPPQPAHAVSLASQTPEATVSEVRPPSYSQNDSSSDVQSPSMASPYVRRVHSCEALPVYEETTNVEPPTLARSLWRWGFLCPFIWILGCFILCSPLRPLEEEEDPTSKQKVDEMIAILREAELKYARRCLISFGSFMVFILLLVVVVVVAIRMR